MKYYDSYAVDLVRRKEEEGDSLLRHNRCAALVRWKRSWTETAAATFAAATATALLRKRMPLHLHGSRLHSVLTEMDFVALSTVMTGVILRVG